LKPTTRERKKLSLAGRTEASEIKIIIEFILRKGLLLDALCSLRPLAKRARDKGIYLSQSTQRAKRNNFYANSFFYI
jgi:hypothetical protein